MHMAQDSTVQDIDSISAIGLVYAAESVNARLIGSSGRRSGEDPNSTLLLLSSSTLCLNVRLEHTRRNF